MTSTTSDRCPIDPRPEIDARYVAVPTADGGTIIYDQTHESAWIQSTDAIDRRAME